MKKCKQEVLITSLYQRGSKTSIIGNLNIKLNHISYLQFVGIN